MESPLQQSREDVSFVSGLDFNPVEEADPSLADSHRVVYDREIPVELRSQARPQEAGPVQRIQAKLLTGGNAAQSYRLELGSEDDLFFHYVHSTEEGNFQALQADQRLMVDFQEFPSVLIRMLNNCLKEPTQFIAVFFIANDGGGHLDFIQNMEYKYVELLSLSFTASPEDVVRDQITFRYKSLKARLQLVQERLNQVNQLVKTKNPSLLLQLQKTPTRKR